jgi:hypothetical protein
LKDAVIHAIEAVCDWQARDFLFKELPSDYQQELLGIQSAGIDVGIPHLADLIKRTLTLANLPGDGKDVLLVLIREYLGNGIADAIGKPHPVPEAFRGFCSMIAAWGPRTAQGNLFSGKPWCSAMAGGVHATRTLGGAGAAQAETWTGTRTRA